MRWPVTSRAKTKKAEAAYKRLVRMRPESDQTYFASGELLCRCGEVGGGGCVLPSGRREECEELSSSVYARSRSVPLQNYSDSAASLESALKLNGSHADSYFWLGKIHVLLGKKEKALECFERAVKLEPKHLGAYYQLGLLYARNGEKEKSKDAMEMQRQLNAQLHKGLIALRMP